MSQVQNQTHLKANITNNTLDDKNEDYDYNILSTKSLIEMLQINEQMSKKSRHFNKSVHKV